MKEKIRYIIGKRSFHIGMVIVIIAIILFILGMIVLKYNVEGETNMPFQLKKIILISSSEGVDKEAGENKWAFDINQTNDKIAEYVSNDEEINHSELLKKSNITEENLRAKLTFDFMIETEAGKEYKANISLNMPVDGVIENGTASDEITDMSNIIFKRTKN